MTRDEVLSRMTKWRRRDENRDNGTWRGISVICTTRSYRPRVRVILAELADEGLIERGVYANGTFYRGLLSPNRIVTGSEGGM